MRIVVSDFVSLDGVVQAPGGRDEDTDGGFAHGGWSMPYFDPEAMGPVLEEVMARTEALLFGRRTWQTMAAAWPGRAGDPFADRVPGRRAIPPLGSRVHVDEQHRGPHLRVPTRVAHVDLHLRRDRATDYRPRQE